MATLNTLRTKGGWIVTIVIGVSLLAFLIGDLAGGNSVFSAGGEKVGSIEGKKISYLEYARKIEQLTEIQTILNNGQSIPAEMQAQLRNYAWETMLNEAVLYPGLEGLGIDISDEEMFDRMYGNNISPVLVNSGLFINNETGQYDKTLLQDFVTNYPLDPTGRMGLLWQHIQDQVRQNAMVEKYQTLLSGLAYVTDAEAAHGIERANTLYNARYVMQGYDTVPDSLAKFTSSEVRSYYNAHKKNYRQTASRSLEYVVFDVVPSAQDYVDAKAQVDELAVEFAAAENIQQYATLNSQDAFDAAYYLRAELPAELAEWAFDPARQPLHGPVQDGNTYTTIRVSDLRSFPDTIGFRQMQFMPGAEALADSIYNVLENGGDFLTLAAEHSIVPAASVDAGRISTRGIPMEIGEQIYNNNGRLLKISNPNGTMILDVYYRGPVSPKVQLARLTYHVEPSSATQQAAYAKASAFYTATAGLPANFNRIAADSAYVKRVARLQAGQDEVQGLGSAREMTRWAFNTKPNAISSILEIDNNYVIATLTGANEDGYASVEQVQPQIAAELMLDKKYEQIAARMTGTSSLDALAQDLSTQVAAIDSINYNTIYIQGVGTMDPPLVGAVAGGVPQGQLSRPIKGVTGVYVVEITSTSTTEQTSPEMERARLAAEAEYSLSGRVFEAVASKSNIVDGRSKYF